MKKETYFAPEIAIEAFATEDIITAGTSGAYDNLTLLGADESAGEGTWNSVWDEALS